MRSPRPAHSSSRGYSQRWDRSTRHSIDAALTNVVAEGFDAGLRLGHTLDREMIAVDGRVVTNDLSIVPRFMSKQDKYAGYQALDPFFEIILNGLSGLVDGDHFFDTFAEDARFESLYDFPIVHWRDYMDSFAPWLALNRAG